MKHTPNGIFPGDGGSRYPCRFSGIWKVRYEAAHNAQGQARDELWAVPAKYDETEPTQPGTVEEVVYNTKAYATDERDVKKTAYVYLPMAMTAKKSIIFFI